MAGDPVLWDAVRVSVDSRNEPGLYILTSSNSVDNSKINHSGTGRIARMRLETMSLFESGELNGAISLSELFENPGTDIEAKSDMEIEQIIFAACRGGWQGFLARKTDRAQLQIAMDYVDSVCETDISTVDGVKRNPAWALQILKSYARNISTLAKGSSILKDVASASESISHDTLSSYIQAFERLFIIQDTTAWCPSICSATAIRSGKKRGFCDPSIAVAASCLNPDYYMTDLRSFGFIFECLCMRDLRAYSAKSGGKISYYHDRYGLEADCARTPWAGPAYHHYRNRIRIPKVGRGLCNTCRLPEKLAVAARHRKNGHDETEYIFAQSLNAYIWLLVYIS